MQQPGTLVKIIGYSWQGYNRLTNTLTDCTCTTNRSLQWFTTTINNNNNNSNNNITTIKTDAGNVEEL